MLRILLSLLVFILPVFSQKSILQEVIDQAKSGSKLDLPSGIYKGNIIINKPLILDGKDQNAIIEGDGNGTVITILSSGVSLKNLTIRHSGEAHERVDAGVALKHVEQCHIENCKIVDTLFGIDMEQVNRSEISGNYIESKPFDLGLRGDGIRLWYSNDNHLNKNYLYRSRDFVVWYSHGNLIENNKGEYGRYSLHFMYTGKNIVKNNVYKHNSVGIFFMYSQDSIAIGNLIQNSLGTTGLGIGMKDASNFVLKDNTIIYCARGLFIDRSPYEPDTVNTIENNRIIYNSEGIHFHSLSLHNIFKGNIFKGNIEHVVNDSYNTKIDKNLFDSNFWDDYEGFDKNNDGMGDTSYRYYAYADKVWLLNPNIKFFYGSPVISILNFLAKLAPFSEPTLLISDKHPKMYEGEV
ncbi:MAG: nitrous oxide reductase family maturation protein NosD [Sulfurovum sp.]|nr:nitrous oxide reductase family maturation protein NosD [Sulfurovum sp.]MCB4746663.1 nitrous oxide reductase family maturation protein NosD [Sulfurovum sp.]MCB4748052.1 nitrous oxide reductase family maturation protein NosD [Sulfurovum sp.]MCB4748833.1 nitrous oxide reductase family maturation protein NosD [Sulfurovum sp.]MCB4751346.1 nitrous oxide reductase family maturation protein NosD [Sulfurovum sp.]